MSALGRFGGLILRSSRGGFQQMYLPSRIWALQAAPAQLVPRMLGLNAFNRVCGAKSLFYSREKREKEQSAPKGELIIKGIVRPEHVFGTNEMKKVRREGFIPARIHNSKGEKVYANLEIKHLKVLPTKRNRYNTVFNVALGEQEPIKCIIRKLQIDPITDVPIHADMYLCTPGVPVEVSVPVVPVNQEKSPGIKQGGVANLVLATVRCLTDPLKMPDVVEVDLTGLNVGQRLWLKDVVLPDGMQIVKLPHYEKCPVVRIGRTRASILEQRRRDEAAAKSAENAAKKK